MLVAGPIGKSRLQRDNLEAGNILAMQELLGAKFNLIENL